MSLDNKPVWSGGGCQCGAVRFSSRARWAMRPSAICRMCQKAFGAFYAPLVSVDEAGLRWTRANANCSLTPIWSGAASAAMRHAACLTRAPDGIALAIGAFDDPSGIARHQFGIEAKLPYVDTVCTLPSRDTMEDEQAVGDFSPASSPFSIPIMTPKPGLRRGTRPYDHGTARPLSGDQTVRDQMLPMSATATPSIGERVGTKAASRPCFCTRRAGQHHLAIGDFRSALYDVILFDQRGCGKSLLNASLGQHHMASGGRHRAAAENVRLRRGWCSADH